MFPQLLLPPSPVPSGHLVVFGATSDLVSKRAVRDALIFLADEGILSPERHSVRLIAQKPISGLDYLRSFRVGDGASTPLAERTMQRISRLFHLEAESSQISGLEVKLATDYEHMADELKGESAVFYAALPPRLYSAWLEGLRHSGLSRPPDARHFRRILLEKPFANSQSEAVRLAGVLERDFAPDQVFLVDHFLAYPGWRHMVRYRAQPGVEAVLNHHYVDRVEVRVLESIKSNDRPYFRETGLIDDMLQNHALQVYSAMVMDLPSEQESVSLSLARQRAVEAIDVQPRSVVWGQFEGFNEVSQGAPPLAPPSQAETLVAFQFKVRLPRWQGVQFYLVNAKGVDHKRSGVDIYLNHLSPELAHRWGVNPQQPAILHTTMNPIDRIWIDFPTTGSSREVPADPEVTQVPPYATLLPEALRGRKEFFATPQESLAGWRLADQVRACLLEKPFLYYRTGSRVEDLLSEAGWPVAERAPQPVPSP